MKYIIEWEEEQVVYTYTETIWSKLEDYAEQLVLEGKTITIRREF